MFSVHLFCIYFLRAYYMLGNVFGTEATAVNKRDQIHALVELII